MSNSLDEGLAQLDEMLDAADGGTPEPAPETEVEEGDTLQEEPAGPQEDGAEQPEPEEAEGPEDSAAEQLLAGKYKTPEELERGYQELQSRLGEQGSELGELRQTIDRLNENLEYEAPAAIDQNTVDWLDEQVEQNPAQAAVYALQNAPELYDRVMETWFEMPGQQRQAAEFVAAVATQRLETQMQQRLAESTGPLTKAANTQTTNEAWAKAAREIPDLNEHADAMLELLKEDPVLKEFMSNKIASGTVEERSSALRSLYWAAKGQQATAVQDASTQSAATEAEASRAAKKAGSVATQTSVADAETVSEGDQWLADIGFDDVLDRHSPPE